MPSDGAESASGASHYTCSNCYAEVGDPDKGDICPVCRVGQLTEMEKAECRDCGSNDFVILQPAPHASHVRADSEAVCSECGARGRLDEDGVWW